MLDRGQRDRGGQRCPLTDGVARELSALSPEAFGRLGDRELIRRAVLADSAQQRSRGGLGFLVAATAGALVLALWLSLSPSSRLADGHAAVASAPALAAPGEHSRLSLPTGDQLLASAGADFEVRSARPALRRVALGHGRMLFDVAALGDDQHFEVVTPQARVSVVGTVFTVEAVDGRTVVRVYEGEVSVLRQGRRVRLRVGEHFVSDQRPAGADPLRPQALAAAEARRLAPRPGIRGRVGEDIGDLVVEAGGASNPAQGAAELAAGAPVVVELSAPPPRAARSAHVSTRPPDLGTARQRLREGRIDVALSAADVAIDLRDGSLGRWYLLRADALLAGGRPREAAAALESAAAYLHGSEARDAAYRSAQVYSEQLGDHARALHVLRASGVLGPEKFIHARGMELWVRLLVALDRRWEASAVARRYLRTYPHSPEAAAMRAVADFNLERPSPPLL